MIGVRISFQYSSEHRYDSDLNEKVRDIVAKLVKETGSEDDGEAGGTGFFGDEFPSDQTYYLYVPDLEVGEKFRLAVDTMIKFYDERYQATMSLMEDVVDNDGDDPEEEV